MILRPLLQSLLLLAGAASTLAASSWGFTDATVSVQGKGTGVGAGFKQKLVEHKPLSKAASLGATDTLKVVLTTQDGKSAKRPHQAFLLLRDSETGLDVAYPFSIKETGKGKVDLTHKDLPTQFLKASKPLDASLVLASFGSSSGYNEKVFSLSIALDPSVPLPVTENPLRYGKQPEINHIFKSDPTSPNIIITLVFTGAVLATLPTLLGTWLYLGGNFNHLPKALQVAPLAHGIFFGSIACIEIIFFMYYTSWNLFKTLPILGVVGVICFLSGSRALTEVQERRLAGMR